MAKEMWADEQSRKNQSIFKLDVALKLIEAMKAKAVETKVPMVLTVADASGDLVAIERMDGTLPVSLDISPNKAKTAARIRATTEELGIAAVPGGPLFGINYTPGFIIFGGGIPLVYEGNVVGAIGVSGGSAAEDVVVAKAGVAAFNEMHK